ncbi:MAG: glycosyltransferase [Vicinamibacterales bacterium]
MSVIVPFHRHLAVLRRVLAPFAARAPHVELIVAADGPIEDWRPVAAEFGARGVELPVRSGPAAARNRGAAIADGEILVFVDGDVIAAPDAVTRMEAVLADPGITAVFGAYDEHPPDPGFFSQYKNLSHGYVHSNTGNRALTFWAGLGAVRTAAFRAVGGYDERFDHPCIEDIEIGYRLTAAGATIAIDPAIQGTHLKRWTLWSSVRSDIVDRGVPWTQLMNRVGATRQTDLNLTRTLRLSVVVSYLLAAAVVLGVAWPAAWFGVPAAFAALVALNGPYYAYFLRVRGGWFAVRVVAAHVLHHLCNGVSFVAGTLLYQARRLGIDLPGSLPLDAMPAPQAAALER